MKRNDSFKATMAAFVLMLGLCPAGAGRPSKGNMGSRGSQRGVEP
jgi:hypothetical protein